MTKLQFTAVSIGMFGLGMIISYSTNKETEKTTEETRPKTKYYESEHNGEHHKMKVFKHETWYGDTMLVTVDTTYYYNK
jgi:hypothetical protein